MIILSILLMTNIVFISRYLFLEPAIPLKLGNKTKRLLRYSSPAVLTSLWAPIVFAPEGELVISISNPYIPSAILALFLAWKTHNVLLTSTLSMGLLLILKQWL